MRAVEVISPGGLDQLILTEHDEPPAAPGSVVIRVAYAGANWSDIQKRRGVYPDKISYPTIIGLEASGTIESIGPGVEGLTVGQPVSAITGPTMLGGYAELCTVGAEFVIPLPQGISLASGAAFPVVSLTAYHLLHSAYEVKRGTTILVHSIGGAVGLAFTQLAVAAGARVIGTVGSAEKSVRPLLYGAEQVVDRSQTDFGEAVMAFSKGRGVDLVIDSLGGEVLPRSIDLLRTYGHTINIGEAMGYPNFDIRARLYQNSTSLAGFELVHAMRVPGAWQRGVEYVLQELTAGRLEIPIEGTYNLEQVRDLHARLEGRGVSGKLLLKIS